MQRLRGFTLLELIVALTLSTLVVGLAVGLYATVQRAGSGIVSAQRDWVALQFLRGQLAHQDRTLNKTFTLVRMERDRLAFVTRKSAQFGTGGPPVLALYHLDGGQLRYREVALPAWWGLKDRESQFDFERLRDTREAFEGTLFPLATDAAFAYWDEVERQWRDESRRRDALSRVVRLTGKLEAVMETTSLAPYSRESQ